MFKPFYLVITIFVVSFGVQLFEPESIQLLRYESDATSQGQWWRILTANFTHYNWNHWLFNMLGLVLIDLIYQPFITQWQRSSLLLFCMLLNILLMHLLLSIHWYVGLSGALHGFLIGGALLTLKDLKSYSAIIIALVTAKLIVELNWEVNQVTASLIDTNVVEEAHLFGAISGVIYYLIWYLFKKVVKHSENVN